MRTEPPPAERPPEDGGPDMPREGEGFEKRGTLNEDVRPMPDEEDGGRIEADGFPPEKFRRNWLMMLPVWEFRLRGEMFPCDTVRVREIVPWLIRG